MPEENAAFDAIDRQIVDTLAEDGRASWRTLGELVRLSPNAVAERVRRLERCGAIRGYRADLDLGVLGRTIEALVDVRLATGTDPDAFEQGAARHPDVLDAVHVTGRFDYQLHVHCADVGALDGLTRTLRRELGAEGTESRIVLRRVRANGSSAVA